MKFKKGHNPWNKGKKTGQIPWIKGKKHSEETKRKLSLSLKGKPGAFKGKKHSEEAKEKNRLAHLGQTSWLKGKKGYTNSGSFKKGHKHSEAIRKKISKAKKGTQVGSKNPFYGKKHSKKSMQRKTESWLKTMKANPEILKKMAKAGFKKGHMPSNKGKKASSELRQKMSASWKKLYASGYVNPMKGRTLPEEVRRNMSLARKGVKYAPGRVSAMKGRKHTDAAKRKASASMKKHVEKYGFSKEHRRKISVANKGMTRTDAQVKAMSKRLKKMYADGTIEVWNKNKIGVFSEDVLEKIRKARSKQVFPRHDSDAEKKLQNLCKTAQIPFIKHKNINLGFQWHQVDLFIEPNICLEADGDFWHANPNPWINKGKWIPGFKADDHIIGKTYAKDKWASDKKITLALEEMGYNVLRFWGTELTLYPEKCFQKIIRA